MGQTDQRLEMMETYYPKFKQLNPVDEKCGNFAYSYEAYCKVFMAEPREEVGWLCNEIYAETQQKSIDLGLLSIQDANEMAAINHALAGNKYFQQLSVCGIKLFESQSLPRLLKYNVVLKEVRLRDLSNASKDFYQALSEALLSNRDSQLTSIDITMSVGDEKIAQQLGTALALLPSGIQSLTINGMSKKQAINLLSSMKKRASNNPGSGSKLASSDSLHDDIYKASVTINQSLQHIDLSNCSLGAEATLILADLFAQPNQLRTVKLNDCSIPNLEVLLGAMARGCVQELQCLHLASNRFSGDASQHAVEQFLKNCQRLRELNLSQCNFGKQLKGIILGLSGNNQNLRLSLNVGNNDFAIKECIELSQLSSVIYHLDLSFNQFDVDDTINDLLEALGRINEVNLKKCLQKNKKRIQIDSLKKLIESPDLQKLILSDNDLKQVLTDALKQSFKTKALYLDISSNAIAETGAVVVAKLLHRNKTIRELHWCDNSVPINYWMIVLEALNLNTTLKTMPLTLQESTSLMKQDHLKFQELQDKLLKVLLRNNIPTGVATLAEKAQAEEDAKALETVQQLARPLLSHVNKSRPKAAKSRAASRIFEAHEMPALDKQSNKSKSTENLLQNVVEKVGLKVSVDSISEEAELKQIKENRENHNVQSATDKVGLKASVDSLPKESETSKTAAIEVGENTTMSKNTSPDTEQKAIASPEVENSKPEAAIFDKSEKDKNLELTRAEEEKEQEAPKVPERKKILAEADNEANEPMKASEEKEEGDQVPEEPVVNKATRPKVSMAKRQSQIDFKNQLNDLILNPRPSSTEPSAEAESEPKKPEEPPIVEAQTSPSPTSPPPRINSNNAVSADRQSVLSTATSAKKKKGFGAKISGFFSKKKDSQMSSQQSLDSISDLNSLENVYNDSVTEKSPSQKSPATQPPREQSPSPVVQKGEERSPSPPKTLERQESPIEVKEDVPPPVAERPPVEKPPMHTGMKFGVRLPFAELPLKKSSAAVEPEEKNLAEESNSEIKKTEHVQIRPQQPPLAQVQQPPVITQKKPDLRGRSESISSSNNNSRARSSSNAPSPTSPSVAAAAVETPKSPSRATHEPSSEMQSLSNSSSPIKPVIPGVKHGVKLPFGGMESPKKEFAEQHQPQTNPVPPARTTTTKPSPPTESQKPQPAVVTPKPAAADTKPQIAVKPTAAPASNANEVIDAAGKWQKAHLEWLSEKCKVHKITLSAGTKSDLFDYFKDGVSLLELVESISNTPAPKYRKNAQLPVHKIDNMNVFIQYLQKLDVSGISNMTAEDLLNGDPKKVLVLMNALEKKYP